MEPGVIAGAFTPVTTGRLTLRCVTTADAAALSALMTPQVSRWLAGWPVTFSVEMATARIADDAARMAAGLAWSCCLVRDDDQLVLGGHRFFARR